MCTFSTCRFKIVFCLQFHLEVTKEIIKEVMAHCPDDLFPSKYTQSANEILTHEFEEINFSMHKLLNNIHSNFEKTQNT